MAEFVLKDMVAKKGLSNQFHIASAATSTEEIGNSVHPGTRRILQKLGIRCDGKVAVQLTSKDYELYDYLIGMDTYNIRNMRRMCGHKDDKIFLLLSFTGENTDIADPWYTGNFETTYHDIRRGCLGFLNKLAL
jgi:protein-tyrosine phosphatase